MLAAGAPTSMVSLEQPAQNVNFSSHDGVPISAAAAPALPALMELALSRVARRWALLFGTGSRLVLASSARRALLDVEARAASQASDDAWLDSVCGNVERAHVSRYGQRALGAELGDERERDAAVSSDAGLVHYESKWRRQLERLQRVRPSRWYVPGLSDEEVRDGLTLQLVDVLRARPELHARYCRAGRPWGLVLAQAHLRDLRRRFRMGATPVDFRELALPERAPALEERWIELEAERDRALAADRARNTSSRTQRRWLDAMRAAAESGQFFDSSERLNLSAVARELGKNRSSAQRAYEQLSVRFRRELGRSG